jgi:DNA-binding MarR family transcriptional regulator
MKCPRKNEFGKKSLALRVNQVYHCRGYVVPSAPGYGVGFRFNSDHETMKDPITPDLIYEFLSSARVFAKAVRDVIEGTVLQGVVNNKLSLPQLKLLYLVAQADSVTISDAAMFLGVSSPAASKTVEKLVRRRLLRRSDIQGDRRSSQLSLTESSRRMLEAYEAARNKKAVEIFSRYSPEVLRDTAELLDHLASGIASQDAAAEQETACMQCEIYYRKDCRFGQFGARKCFYQLHKKELRDQTAASAGYSPEQP